MSLAPLVVGGCSLLLTVAHVVAGGRSCARPMLDAEFDPVAKQTLYVCWHAVSAYLAGSGILLVWAGSAPSVANVLLVQVIGVSYLVCGGLCLVIAARSQISGAWYKLGQWMAFVPMGLAALLGS